MDGSYWKALRTGDSNHKTGRRYIYAALKRYQFMGIQFSSSDEFRFLDWCHAKDLPSALPDDLLVLDVDPETTVALFGKKGLVGFTRCHGVRVPSSATISKIKESLQSHCCPVDTCQPVALLLQVTTRKPTSFPPEGLTAESRHRMLVDIAEAFKPESFIEEGCMVCGELKLRTELRDPPDDLRDTPLLKNSLVAFKERASKSNRREPLTQPIFASGCDKMCLECLPVLKRGRAPRNALSNGLWLGDVPHQLQNLTFAEQQLIAKVRHNRCVVRVLTSKRGKMMANAVMFHNPTLKVYNKLPPAKDELSEILAFVWIGADLPKATDYKRTPMLVRRDKVRAALEWLRINNPIYRELELSEENLATYELIDVPVTCDWRKTEESNESEIESGISSVHGQEAEGEGTLHGPCTFRVHGLTGDKYEKMSEEELKLKALNHMHAGYDVLGVGHSPDPESMYDNPSVYPSMFPWLFPYGMGGLGNPYLSKNFGEAEHKRHLLMYYDKWFQKDLYFPLIAFNHVQIKGGVTGSFLLAKKDRFDGIAERLLSINKIVLKDVTTRMNQGERLNYYSAKTEEEKKCFRILDDLDLVGGHVKGSITTKKYMRNEIWSLAMHLGAPSWFITLSPADVKHPLCLYYAGESIEFDDSILTSNQRNHLIANNSVAAARFFHYMVRVFLDKILRAGQEEEGAYGKTTAYYGTVEQQGRLTLHLHALIWIEGAPTPQEIRDKLKGPDGKTFGESLKIYLESCHRGEFTTGSMESVKAKIPKADYIRRRGFHDIEYEDDVIQEISSYKDPTQTLPTRPPDRCSLADKPHDVGCVECEAYRVWILTHEQTVDDLVFRSNIHTHHGDRAVKTKKGTIAKGALFGGGGCLNAEGICTARFPRDVVAETTIDYDAGTVTMKHLEPMLNTITGLVTWATRSNTDSSSLLSGTALQAAISYIADYITKPGLKTYHVLGIMNDLLHARLEQVLGGDSESR